MLSDDERALTPQQREKLRMEFYGRLMRELAKEFKSQPTSEPPAIDTRDGATPQRLAMAGEAIEDYHPQDGRLTLRMLDGSAVHMLYRRSVIDADQYNAGDQFYADWYFAGFANSGVIDPGRVIVDGGPITGETDRKIDAATRFKDAILAAGETHSRVLVDVVLFEVRLEDWGRRVHGHRDRKDARLAAITSLRDALQQLSYHYYGKRRRRMRASHADGYRPEITDPLDTSSPRE